MLNLLLKLWTSIINSCISRDFRCYEMWYCWLILLSNLKWNYICKITFSHVSAFFSKDISCNRQKWHSFDNLFCCSWLQWKYRVYFKSCGTNTILSHQLPGGQRKKDKSWLQCEVAIQRNLKQRNINLTVTVERTSVKQTENSHCHFATVKIVLL